MKIWTAVGAATLAVALSAGVLTAPSYAASAASAGAHARKAAATKVTLTANRRNIVANNRVVFRGTVTPGAAGAKVVLQQRLEGKSWATTGTGKVARNGTYELSDRPHVPGYRKYRVVVPARTGHRAGVSPTVSLTVYRWVDLTTVTTRNRVATDKESGVDFDTVMYSPAMVGQSYAQDGYADWNLERRCTYLRAVVGLSDESDASAIADISIVADGASVYEKSFALTQSEFVNIDIKGAFRISFNWTGSNPEADPDSYRYGVKAALAKPQVLCAFGAPVTGQG